MNLITNFMIGGVGMLSQGLGTYAHEWGHAKAIDALFQDANPAINVENWIFGGGSCSYSMGNPTSFGSRFSQKTRRGIIAAAGPIADYVNITSSLIASWNFRNKCNPLAISLASHAYFKSLNTFAYSYDTENLDSDYSKIAINLSIPHSSLCIVTGTTALISGIWLTYLVVRSSYGSYGSQPWDSQQDREERAAYMKSLSQSD